MMGKAKEPQAKWTVLTEMDAKVGTTQTAQVH